MLEMFYSVVNGRILLFGKTQTSILIFNVCLTDISHMDETNYCQKTTNVLELRCAHSC